MAPKRVKLTSDLAALYSRHVSQQRKKHLPDWSGNLARLRERHVVKVGDLLARLSSLPPTLRHFGVDLMGTLEIYEAVPVLLDLMSDQAVRMQCASTLCFMKPGWRKIEQFFVRKGRQEMASCTPDRDWLEAVVHRLGHSDNRPAVDLLLAIFERADLPGWLRGDAADKLGCRPFMHDRRTRFFRRCRDAALRGLKHDSIYVQFGSMYLIGSLCSNRRGGSISCGCETALPRLRKIASNDHRLSPGFWWPMSAEAEDVICCVTKGHWPELDAGERWTDTSKRGEWERE
jgi:hypothetical protein